MPQASNIMYRDSETKVTAFAFRNPQQCPLSTIKKIARFSQATIFSKYISSS